MRYVGAGGVGPYVYTQVGVFVSLVSTKIPFKGAGKEYIGDDVEEMVAAVRHAIQQCCQQLRTKIARAQVTALLGGWFRSGWELNMAGFCTPCSTVLQGDACVGSVGEWDMPGVTCCNPT